MKYLKVFVDFTADTQELNEAEMGRLFRGMLTYASSGEAPDLRGSERYVWPAVKRGIDAQRASYENICTINKRIANERSGTLGNGASRSVTERDKNKNKNINKETLPKGNAKKAGFCPPSLQEVTEYCTERGNTVKPEAFISFYESNGWMVGKNRMRDWKAAVRTWELRPEYRNRSAKRGMGIEAPYKQKKISDAEFDALFDEV